jgi:hypothetical protein
MGFALSILYFITYYLGPSTVFGSLAAYNAALIIAALAIVVSLPVIPRSLILKTPQSLALAGLAAAVFLSVLATGWVGGAITAFQRFIPGAFAYFLVCLHCNTRKKLQILVLLLLSVSLFVIIEGNRELIHSTSPRESETLPGDVTNTVTLNSPVWNAAHPYLLAQQAAPGKWIFRIRGMDQINDPNDFGQLLVCVIPLAFIFWRPKKLVRNTLVVLLPVCGLLYGTFLTHSRGALFSLMAMAIVAGRRRIGTIPALLLAGVLFSVAFANGFTGGRDISSGSGRMVLWGESIGVLKSHPLFGVGFGELSDHMEQTSHNSIMVCAAETGMLGLFFWTMFLLSTLRDTLTLGSPEKVSEGEPDAPGNEPPGYATRPRDLIEKPEIIRLGRLLILSFIGFLTAGFFLSRAFVLTLFLLGGIAEVIYQWALQRGMVSPRLKLGRVMLYSAPLSVALVVGVYIFIRIGILF